MDVTINCIGRTLDEESCNTHPCPSKHKYSCTSKYGKLARLNFWLPGSYLLNDVFYSGFLFKFSVNGNWSEWSPFGTCSQSCGGGTQFRFRTCDNPPPQHGGRDCEGEVADSRLCNTHHCPSK